MSRLHGVIFPNASSTRATVNFVFFDDSPSSSQSSLTHQWCIIFTVKPMSIVLSFGRRVAFIGLPYSRVGLTGVYITANYSVTRSKKKPSVSWAVPSKILSLYFSHFISHSTSSAKISKPKSFSLMASAILN